MVLTHEKRKTLVTILVESGKYSFTGLVIGYFALQPSFSPWVAVIGATFAIFCYTSAIYVSE